MLTKEKIEEIINSDQDIRSFCRESNISTVTFHNYRRKYGIKGKNQKFKQKISSTVGQKFGRWNVIEYIENVGSKNCMLKCLCDCGTEQLVRYYDLIDKKTTGCNNCSTEARSKNCGKHKREKGCKSYSFKGYKELTGHQWSVYKANAKKRNIDFNITIEYAYSILEKQEFKCNLSGIDIKLGSNESNGRWTATMDRINSTIGYEEGNIQWLHKDINTMKWAFSQEKFLEYCIIITGRQKNKDG